MNILIYSKNNTDDVTGKISREHVENIKKTTENANVTITNTPTENELQKTDVLIPILPAGDLPLNKMTSLKWIHVISAGVDKYHELLKGTKIIVTNSSGVHPLPISEQIFAYILMFAREFHKTHRVQTVEKRWLDKKHLQPFEVHGATIGIVGMGRIGLETARVAKGFNMKVLGMVTNKNRIVEQVDELLETHEFDALLSQSDFVVNCLPGTEFTEKFYTYEKFKKMKKSAYFINIGRGSTVNENDLIKALKEDVIAGAGLDVFEEEPLPNDSPLWQLENVIITPHSAGKTPYYMDRVIEIFCQNLEAYLRDEKMPNIVDLEKGY